MSIHVDSVNEKSSLADVCVAENQAGDGIQKATQEGAGAEETQRQAQGAASEARREAAGEEQAAKFDQGSTEGEVFVAGAGQMAPAADMALNLWQGLNESKSNPSQGADIAKAKAGSGGIVSKGAQSMEDLSQKMKQAPKQSSLFTKKDSARSLTEKMGTSGDIATTKGAEAHEKSAAVMQNTAQIKMECGVANKQVLATARHLKGSAPAPSALGQSADTSINTLNKIKANPEAHAQQQPAPHHQQMVAKLDMDLSKGPNGYEYPKDDTTDTDSGWVG